ncbi:hypothetical protein [Clostridium mediterraneense]|uniref:hypothetical protein n=1 Tax=Clostridium mediterraneense TaxID=1805472 RepID=UPI000836781F|nr:hypothetical protein [Clostridium mediterraneense]
MTKHETVEERSLDEAIEYFEKKYKNIKTKSDEYNYFSELSYFISDQHKKIQNLNLNDRNWCVRLVSGTKYKFMITIPEVFQNAPLTFQQIAALKRYSEYVLENKSTINLLYKNGYFLIYIIIVVCIVFLANK